MGCILAKLLSKVVGRKNFLKREWKYTPSSMWMWFYEDMMPTAESTKSQDAWWQGGAIELILDPLPIDFLLCEIIRTLFFKPF